jgi:hypothetical protein
MEVAMRSAGRYTDYDLEGITFRIPSSWPTTVETNRVTATVPHSMRISAPGYRTIAAAVRLYVARRLVGLSREPIR